MFGTLVVQLPVEGGQTGGTLSVRHGDQEVSTYYILLKYMCMTLHKPIDVQCSVQP
jgi:hypothetical protein